MKPMYKAQVNSPETFLMEDITVSTTDITVQDGGILPDAPTLLVIGGGALNAETVKLVGKQGNTLTIERGFEGEAQPWEAGVSIARNFTAYDHDATIDNIETLASENESIGTRITSTQSSVSSLSNLLFPHISNRDNPHNVTAAQVGLGNVDNTSDADKPVSWAQNAMFSSFSNTLMQHIMHRDNPHNVTTTQLGHIRELVTPTMNPNWSLNTPQGAQVFAVGDIVIMQGPIMRSSSMLSGGIVTGSVLFTIPQGFRPVGGMTSTFPAFIRITSGGGSHQNGSLISAMLSALPSGDVIISNMNNSPAITGGNPQIEFNITFRRR